MFSFKNKNLPFLLFESAKASPSFAAAFSALLKGNEEIRLD